MADTGLSRATAHRLAVALEAHGLVRRDADGRFCLGLRLIGLGRAAAEALPGWLDARPALERLRDETGETVQLFVRDGDDRVCVGPLESPHGLRTIVPVGAASAPRPRLGRPGAARPGGGSRTGGSRAWTSASRAWRRSAPRCSDADGRVVAAVSVSGPIDRLTRSPGQRHGAAVVEAAKRISP